MLRQFPAVAATLLVAALIYPPVRAASEPVKPATPTRNFAAEIAQVRGAWTRSSGELYDILTRLGHAVDTTRDLTQKLEAKRREITALEAKRDRALEEMRHGEFCTGCGRTRSDILAHGEHFPHDGQRVRPATPEELENARRNFENQLEPLRAELAQLQQRKNATDGNVSDLYVRYLALYPHYHEELSDECRLRIAAWLAESGALAGRIRELNGKLIDAERAFAVASGSDREALKVRVEQARRLLQDAVANARAATARAAGEERDFVLAANNDVDRLGNVAVTITGGFGTPDGWYIDKVLRSIRSLDYTVNPVAGADSFPHTTSDARDLLEGGSDANARKPAQDSSASARDLLDGR